MRSWLQDNPILGVLSALAILLAVVIGVEGEFGASVGSVIRPGAARRAVATDAKLLPPIIAIAPEVAYPETVARPVFSPTRRPAPEAPATAQSTFQKGQFVLQGVIVVGTNRVALLREKSSGRIIRIERGKEVNGIQVVEIQPETVTLSLGSEQEMLSLSVQKPAPGAPGAAAAPAATPQGGPFASTTPAAAPGAPAAPAPGAPQAAAPAAVFPPFARPLPGGAQPNAPQPAGTPNSNPAARATTDAAAAPMTPEELLERRRARRTPQNQ
jgi:general secretion pathway protein N